MLPDKRVQPRRNVKTVRTAELKQCGSENDSDEGFAFGIQRAHVDKSVANKEFVRNHKVVSVFLV